MPGGMVETGESLEQAAIREVVEETGLRLGPLIFNRYHEIIQRDEYGEVRTHVVLAMFVGKSDSGDAVAGDDAESVDWFTVEQLSRLSLTGDTAIFVHESLNHLPLL
jgi:8-oxo-dGTP diphosphatase